MYCGSVLLCARFVMLVGTEGLYTYSWGLREKIQTNEWRSAAQPNRQVTVNLPCLRFFRLNLLLVQLSTSSVAL